MSEWASEERRDRERGGAGCAWERATHAVRVVGVAQGEVCRGATCRRRSVRVHQSLWRRDPAGLVCRRAFCGLLLSSGGLARSVLSSHLNMSGSIPRFHPYIQELLNTRLWDAAGEGDFREVARLLRDGADATAVIAESSHRRVRIPIDGRTALHLAALRGHRRVVELLVPCGDVEARDHSGGTALHAAAWRDQPAIVELLLALGADVRAVDRMGRTALHEAALRGNCGVAVMLIDGGADVAATESDSRNHHEALHIAALEGHHTVVALLVDRGADVGATNIYGETALHRAAERGHLRIVELLLALGAQVNAVQRNRMTALHYAARNGHRGVVELLATRGADVCAEDSEGWTPIHQAALPGKDRNGNRGEPDVGIINYLLRETGAIVPLAQNVVKAHYRRQKRIVQGLRGAVDNPRLLEDIADTLLGVVASGCDPGDAKLKSLLQQIAGAAGDATGAQQEANRARKRRRGRRDM